MSDKELRERVRLFGNLLGNILNAQAGERVFVAVETLRKGYLTLHGKENVRKRQQLAEFISELDPETLTHVGRCGQGRLMRHCASFTTRTSLRSSCRQCWSGLPISP